MNDPFYESKSNINVDYTVAGNNLMLSHSDWTDVDVSSRHDQNFSESELRCVVSCNGTTTTFTLDGSGSPNVSQFASDIIDELAKQNKIGNLWESQTITMCQVFTGGSNNNSNNSGNDSIINWNQESIPQRSHNQFINSLENALKDGEESIYFLIKDISKSPNIKTDCVIDMSSTLKKVENIKIRLNVSSELERKNYLWLESWLEFQYEITSLLQSGTGRWHDKYTIYDCNNKLIKKLSDFIDSIKTNGNKKRVEFKLQVRND